MKYSIKCEFFIIKNYSQHNKAANIGNNMLIKSIKKGRLNVCLLS